MPRSYPPEFRRKVLDLVAAGKPIAEVAESLGLSDQTIYNWRRQDLIDRGERVGVGSAELEELRQARRRIAALEADSASRSRGSTRGGAERPPNARSVTLGSPT
jgi:transposase